MCTKISATDTTKNTHYIRGKAYSTSESLWENLYDQGVIDTGIHKSKYHWAYVSWSIKIKVKEGNVIIMSNMIPYKLKMMHVEDFIQIFSPIRQNIHAYPREETNCCDDSTFFPRITSTRLILSSLITQVSESITFQKSDIQSYPISTLVVQNTGSNQSK